MRDQVHEYRRKSYRIEAIQFNGVNIDAIRDFVGKKMTAYNAKKDELFFNTLDGMAIIPKDYFVIKRDDGSFTIRDEKFFYDLYEDDF